MKIAIIQAAPVYNQLEASLEKALSLVKQAAQKGASLVVLGECWLAGYPAWLDHCPDVALWQHESTKAMYAQMLGNSLQIGSAAFQRLATAAMQNQIWLMLGVNESCATGYGNGSLFNSLLLFGPDGKLHLHHRKLCPTYTEKLLYAHGDGKGLHTVQSPEARIGGLICWEHWMPLSRQALHQAGEDIHIALWPSVSEIHQLASRHYAFEGKCYVVAVGSILQVKALPKILNLPEHLASNPNAFMQYGGSCVYGPEGECLLEPQMETENIFVLELDIEKCKAARMYLDVGGHYSRPDVFSLNIHSERPE